MKKRLLKITSKPEVTAETLPQKVTYKVMLRDYFENEWADLGDKGYTFDIKDEALKRRDELNRREFGTTTPPYDHYGVVEMTGKHRGHEIECPATFKSL